MFPKIHAMKDVAIEQTRPETETEEAVYIYEIPNPPKRIK